MKRWIARITVPVVIGGAALAIAAPAQAIWVDGGHYEYLSYCRNVGNARVAHGTYTTYVCERDAPFYALKGWV